MGSTEGDEEREGGSGSRRGFDEWYAGFLAVARADSSLKSSGERVLAGVDLVLLIAGPGWRASTSLTGSDSCLSTLSVLDLPLSIADNLHSSLHPLRTLSSLASLPFAQIVVQLLRHCETCSHAREPSHTNAPSRCSPVTGLAVVLLSTSSDYLPISSAEHFAACVVSQIGLSRSS